MKHIKALLILPGESPQLGLWLPGRPKDYHAIDLPVKVTGPELLRHIINFLSVERLEFHDLTHVGVMAGPASYTHLRICVATANTLAWTLSIPLFSVPLNAQFPDVLPTLIATAHVNAPIEPVYPPLKVS